MFSSLLAVALTLASAQPDATAPPESQPPAVYRHLGPTPPPHGYPEILGLHLSTTNVKPGRAVSGSVTTSENVGYVEARVDNYNAPFHRDGPGQFSLTYTVPWWLPFWLRHGYSLQLIARSVDGVETIREVGIVVR